jgi:hypothetical protein
MEATRLSVKKDWPHAPTHGIDSCGAYMATAALYKSGSQAMVKTIYAFKIDKLKIAGDY